MSDEREHARQFRARSCTSCALRFPVEDGSTLGQACPVCGGVTRWVDTPWRTHGAAAPPRPPVGVRIEILVDNVRSLSNIGTIFRTADGAGVTHVHLGGITPTPAHPKLAKTALGAEKVVAWSHDRDACALAARLLATGRRLWALEGGAHSHPLFEPDLVRQARTGAPLVLVLGHEVSGIDPRIVALCERVVHLPMEGIKTSLNVAVAMGIAAYVLRHVCVD